MDKLLGWMKRHGLRIEKARLLGFNNPSPSPASANYGYEQWVVLEGEAGAAAEAATGADEDIDFKDFPGGLYAVAEHRGRPENLPSSWGTFSMAVERSPYRRSTRQWLEEVLTPELLALGEPTDWDAFGFDLFIAVEEDR
jgi:DNA gyrase inhibitor GyrI